MALEIGPLLPCPKCSKPLEPASWRDGRRARCRWCETEIEFRPYPALTATSTVAKAQAVVLGDDATCFFHVTNQATVVCGGCGRLLCAVCSVPHEGGVRCPSCISTERKQQDRAVNSRFVWGGAALATALVPLIIYPFTAVTGPTAVVISILGWRKPDSLVHPGRWKLVVAGLLGLGQCVAWGFVIFKLATH